MKILIHNKVGQHVNKMLKTTKKMFTITPPCGRSYTVINSKFEAPEIENKSKN